MKFGILISLLFILSGCGNLYPPWNNPRDYPIDFKNIEQEVPTIVSMTDEIRSIIIVPNAVTGEYSGIRICSEPPPDASDDSGSSFKVGGFSESENNNDDVSKPSKGVNKSSSSSLSSILNRSQGLALFRDGSHALCLAWLNDIYNNGDLNSWRDDFRYLLLISSQLINKELEKQGSGDVASDAIKQK